MLYDVCVCEGVMNYGMKLHGKICDFIHEENKRDVGRNVLLFLIPKIRKKGVVLDTVSV